MKRIGKSLSLQDESYDGDFSDWNDEIVEDTQPDLSDLDKIVVAPRDWTVETVISQIKEKNIDLNPKFQRRNAWDDKRRSRLIESLILGMPIPGIILAEVQEERSKFIIIDGKQRLTTIAGFIEYDVTDYKFWNSPRLTGLLVRKDLNGVSYRDFVEQSKYSSDRRKLLNQDVRCSFITNYRSQDILYDIFYRLNTGSVSLSTQELRQVLNKGDFAEYLIEVTSKEQPIHQVIGLNGPDNRLRDAELILRFISFVLFGESYKGNLKVFLDESMKTINADWGEYKSKVEEIYEQLNSAIGLLTDIFSENVGRKFADGKWERRFNKVLFEVQAYFCRFLIKKRINSKQKKAFLQEFQLLCDQDRDFRSSIEASTKNTESYKVRFLHYRKMVNKSLNLKIGKQPLEM